MRDRREVLRLAENWLAAQLEATLRDPALEPMMADLNEAQERGQGDTPAE